MFLSYFFFCFRYKAQLDVLRQLEQRLRDLILNLRKSASASDSQRLQKLERDFERVQATAQSCSARVTRQQKQYQQRGDAAALQANNAAANTLQQEQQRFQMQVQEDVSSWKRRFFCVDRSLSLTSIACFRFVFSAFTKRSCANERRKFATSIKECTR